MRRSRTVAVFARMRGRCSLLWLVAALVLVRALLPTGYMPDAAALRQGVIAMTLCSADGTLRHMTVPVRSPAATVSSTALPVPSGTVPVSSPDLPDDAPAMQDAALCSFGLASTWAVAPEHLASVPAPSFRYRQAHRLAHNAAPTRGAAGPPLGSRAPPTTA